MNTATALILKREEIKGPLTFDQIGKLDIETDPKSIASRNELVLKAREIEQVAGEASQKAAVNIQTELKELKNETEATRKSIKAPVDALVKKIDRTAKTFIEPVLSEIDRLQKLLNNYTNEQAIKAAEEERKRQQELARLEAERKKLEQQAAVSTDAGEVAQIQKQQKQIHAAQSTALSAPDIKKVEGTKITTVPKYDVVDIQALAKARPDLCKIEPAPLAIKAAIKAGMRECPGLSNIRMEKELIV